MKGDEGKHLTDLLVNKVLSAKLQLLCKTSESKMNLIDENLWLGDLNSAQDADALREKGIHSIVTVMDVNPVPSHEGCNQLFIRAYDVSSQDLLSHFSSVFEFIEQGKTVGGVLVHCFQGISRSATLVMSYLMKKHQMPVKKALKKMQKARPIVQPNEGFLHQLQLYELLLKFNQTDSIVRRWYDLQRIAKSIPSYESHQLREEQLLQMDSLMQRSSSSSSFIPSTPALKCKHCRCVLVGQEDVLPHRSGQGPDWKDPSWVEFALSPPAKHPPASSCRQSFFVLPVPWMTEKLGRELEGKIQCPKCNSKLGGFSWKKESPCPCQAAFCPAFYFITSRVDPV